jgi:flagellar motor switch/type III secretory pathway protein FliN
MFTQEDIDAVLNQAQTAVDALAQDVDDLAGKRSPDLQPGPASSGPPPVTRSSAAPPAWEARPPLPSSQIDRIRRLKVPVVVRLARRRMSLGEVMKVVPGTIVEFTQTVDKELDLLVNNHQIGAGVAVKVDEHFGLRVTVVGDLRKRIQSLAR